MVHLSLLSGEKNRRALFRSSGRRQYRPCLPTLETGSKLFDEGFSRRLGTRGVLRPGEELRNPEDLCAPQLQCGGRERGDQPVFSYAATGRRRKKPQN